MKRIKVACFLTMFAACGTNMNNEIHKDLRSAELYLITPTERYSIKYCNAIRMGDSLVISVQDSLPNNAPYTFELIKHGSRWGTAFSVTAIPTDSSYRVPEFVVYKQNVMLNSKSYEKGDSLNGTIDLKAEVHHSWSVQFMDTISVFGVIRTVIK